MYEIPDDAVGYFRHLHVEVGGLSGVVFAIIPPHGNRSRQRQVPCSHAGAL